jgi:hypothetical protein
MRMVHYYLALACVLAPCLLLTLATGALHDGSERHLMAGFFTAILCVATHTLLILFMIVSGRVLKAAMQSRELPPEFLDELNRFFAQRRAYPLAIVSAFAATAAAVLGYGSFIGVPPAVHVLVGVGAALVNLLALGHGVRSLRANQDLLDRAARELDRLDAAGAPVRAGAGEPQWSVRPATRWLVFALSAWGPYLYWALVVWRGAFGQVPQALPVLSGLVSLFGLAQAFRARAPSSG